MRPDPVIQRRVRDPAHACAEGLAQGIQAGADTGIWVAGIAIAKWL
jgi:hypothetical protein